MIDPARAESVPEIKTPPIEPLFVTLRVMHVMVPEFRTELTEAATAVAVPVLSNPVTDPIRAVTVAVFSIELTEPVVKDPELPVIEPVFTRPL